MTSVNKDLRYIDNFTLVFVSEFPEVKGKRLEKLDCVNYHLYDLGAIILRPLGEQQTDIVFCDPPRLQSIFDPQIQRRLGREFNSPEYILRIGAEEYRKELERLSDEEFQERLQSKKSLESEYWERLRRELSISSLNGDGTPASKNEDGTPERPDIVQGGRPKNEGYDWAFQRIQEGEAQDVVYREWLKKYKGHADSLRDPYESFKKAIERKRKLIASSDGK